MATKKLDQKGRVTLGSKYAGQTVVIDDSNPDCIVIKPVVLIPAQEAWLYKNATALDRVRDGLDEAERGDFSDSQPQVEDDLNQLNHPNDSSSTR